MAEEQTHVPTLRDEAEIRADIAVMQGPLTPDTAQAVTLANYRLAMDVPALLADRDAWRAKALTRAGQRGFVACGAWGGCVLPKGHNMGRADVPENHQVPR